MCSEISKNVLNKIQEKEPDIANQITLKFLNWKINESLQGLAEKEVL